MKYRYVDNSELLYSDKLKIAELKNQHWNYGIESQLTWLANNLNAGDIHILCEDNSVANEKLLAYCTLIKIDVCMDGKKDVFLGIGNVCVDKDIQKTGVGKQLLDEVARHIRAGSKKGLLLCKDSLVGFYKKSNWSIVQYHSAVVADKKYEFNIMSYGDELMCSDITINRNF